MRVIGSLFIALLLLNTSPLYAKKKASAPAVAPDSDVIPKQQRKGFFFRLAAGAGFAKTKYNKHDLDAASLPLEISIGSGIVENFALHATVFATCGFAPQKDTTSFCLSAFGLGTTYYIMPQNVFFSLILGLGRETATGNTQPFESSNIGFAMRALVGKEWWVSHAWSLGLAGAFTFGTFDNSGYTNNHFSGGLLFSATYN